MQLKPISEIKARLGIDANGRVQKFLTQTCYKHMDKFVPREDGTLRENVLLKDDSITYQSPYAHYQYIGKKYVDSKTKKGAFYSEDYGYWSRPGEKKEATNIDLNYHTAGTGPYWDKKMVSAEIDEVVDEVQQYIGGKK